MTAGTENKISSTFALAEIDFCDENGRLAKINDLKNWEYATETLKPQMAYVVIKFQSTQQII